MKIPEIEPPIRTGEIPPWSKLDEYTFQDICRDVLAEEPDVATASVYGTRGYKQHGIDIEAPLRSGGAVDVAQVKRYQTFSVQDVRQACSEFLENKTKWRARNVRRFILIVSCEITQPKTRDEIAAQSKKFDRYSISFEVWDGVVLARKLRTHREIVSLYIPHWVETLCGRLMPSGPQQSKSRAPDVAETSAFAELSGKVSKLVVDKVGNIRLRWRRGEAAAAQEAVREIKSDGNLWAALNAETRSIVLRLEAGLVLDNSGNTKEAAQLLNQAKRIRPTDNQRRLRALILLKENKAKEALKILRVASDPDERSLKGAILLQLGKVDDALAEVNEGAGAVDPHADSLRIRAFAHLLKQDFVNALRDATRAYESDPDAYSIRLAYGQISYYCALSPNAFGRRIEDWPLPIPLAFVLRDEESLRRMKNAAGIFAALRASMPDRADRANLDAWELACLACDPDDQQTAERFCRNLIKENRRHFRALIWASSRQYDISFEKSIQAIRRSVAEGIAETGELLAVFHLLQDAGRIDELNAAILGARKTFASDRERLVWESWKIHGILASEGPKAALKRLRKVRGRHHLRDAEMAIYQAGGDAAEYQKPLLRLLHKAYGETRDSVYLLELCEVAARIGDWPLIARHVNELSETRAPYAIRLGAYSLFNTNKILDCLQHLESHRSIFFHGQYPSDLRRLVAQCHARLGQMSQALAAAEEAAREEPSKENLFQLFDAQVRSGDLREAALVARRIVANTKPSAKEAHRLAAILQSSDLDLSKALWRAAAAQPVPDDLVGPLLSLGYSLGVEDELGTLFKRMVSLGRARRGGVVAVKLPQVIKFVKAQSSKRRSLERYYREGQGAIHAIAEGLNIPLANVYIRNARQSEQTRTPLIDPYILARHGGRPLLEAKLSSLQSRILHIDVTASLLASFLGVFELIIEQFERVSIPQELIPALVKMQTSLAPHQRTTVEAAETLRDLIARGKITVVSADNSAQDEIRKFIRHASENTPTIVALSPFKEANPKGGSLGCLVSIGKVVKLLHDQGQLSADQFSAVKRKLGSQAACRGTKTVQQRVPLYITQGAAMVVATTAAVRSICARFDVRVSNELHDQVQKIVEDDVARRETLDAITRAISVLNGALANRKIEMLAARDVDVQKKSENLDLEGLSSIFMAANSADHIIWVDDRAVTAYPHSNGALIVGTNDLLSLLKRDGRIATTSYFVVIDRMRAANVRYIPLSSEELVFQLNCCNIENDSVVETAELITIRRSVASCLVTASDVLQKPIFADQQAISPGEAPFIISITQACTDALRSIWVGRGALVTQRAKSKWIIDNIYVDVGSGRHVAGLAGEAEDALLFSAISIAALIARVGLSLGSVSGSRNPQREFLDWLFFETIEERARRNPRLLGLVVDRIKAAFSEMISEGEKDPHKRAALIVLFRRLHSNLPRVLQEEIKGDNDFMGQFGLNVTWVTTIFSHQFASEELWNAVAKAVCSGRASVKTLGNSKKMFLRRHEARPDVLNVRFAAKDKWLSVVDGPWPLLAPSIKEREEYLNSLQYLRDLPDRKRKVRIATIALLENHAGRVAALNQEERQSPTAFYGALRKRLHAHATFRESELFPDNIGCISEFLTRGVRVGKYGFAHALKGGAMAVARELGYETLCDRYGLLPFELPRNVANLLRGTGFENLRKVLFVNDGPRSPVRIIQLLRFVLHTHATPATVRFARKILHRIFVRDVESTKCQFRALQSTVNWVHNQLVRHAEAGTWSPDQKLAVSWFHGSQIFEAFVSEGATFEWLERVFRGRQLPLSEDLFRREELGWFDIAHPRHFQPEPLMHAALGYCVSPDLARTVGATLCDEIKKGLGTVAEGVTLHINLMSLAATQSDLLQSVLGFRGRTSSRKNLPLNKLSRECDPSTINEVWVGAMKDIAAGKNVPDNWALLSATYGHAKYFLGNQRRLQKAILATDFVKAAVDKADFGTMGLYAATSLWLHRSGSPTFKHLESELRRYAHFLEERRVSLETRSNVDVSEDQSAGLFLDAMFNLSAQLDGELKAAEHFKDMLQETYEKDDEVFRFVRGSVARFVYGLPIQLGQIYLALMVRIRAST